MSTNQSQALSCFIPHLSQDIELSKPRNINQSEISILRKYLPLDHHWPCEPELQQHCRTPQYHRDKNQGENQTPVKTNQILEWLSVDQSEASIYLHKFFPHELGSELRHLSNVAQQSHHVPQQVMLLREASLKMFKNNSELKIQPIRIKYYSVSTNQKH